MAGNEAESENEDFRIDKNEDQETIYQCKVCDITYKTKQGVRQHISKKHRKKEVEPNNSLNIEEIEREVASELNKDSNDDVQPTGIIPSLEEFQFMPPNSQADFDLNVTSLFENHEKEKDNHTTMMHDVQSPSQSTPKVANTISWRTKYEEKENELTLATVKLASIEQKLREKEDIIDAKEETIEKHVNTESEHLEEIRVLKIQLKDKDELLQTAVAQAESSDFSTKNSL